MDNTITFDEIIFETLNKINSNNDKIEKLQNKLIKLNEISIRLIELFDKQSQSIKKIETNKMIID
jgi:hypothetical protein